jgi:hypothetical protein
VGGIPGNLRAILGMSPTSASMFKKGKEKKQGHGTVYSNPARAYTDKGTECRKPPQGNSYNLIIYNIIIIII